jgi:RNA polymerase sigma-70 factor (ECF subfamily)
VHDTWVRAVEGLTGFRGASTLRTWLTGILVNRLREGSRVRVHETLDDSADTILPPPPPLPNDIDVLDLHAAVDAMPARYREVFLLHDVEGFSHREIASLLGIAEGTSKSQLTRGRHWLRARLDGSMS